MYYIKRPKHRFHIVCSHANSEFYFEKVLQNGTKVLDVHVLPGTVQ